MVTNKRKLFVLGQGTPTDAKVDLHNEVDALFRLPLGEFTGARNALAARLKKSGQGDDAVVVKALVKPSISAWAVNQLYWNHREAFERLIASGQRFHKAQTSRSAVKVADMRAALDARRDALTQLSDLAAALLQDAGNNPTLDIIRRITATLEGVSAYASRSDAPPQGRLTADVDPPGFEMFGASIPSAGMERLEAGARKQTTKGGSQKAGSERPLTQITQSRDNKRQAEEARKAKIAAARISLQEAKRSLTEARATAKSLEGVQKKAVADTKEAEKKKRDAEERLDKAKATSEEAARRVRSVAVEVEEAATAVEDASRQVEEASHELEKLFGE